MFLNIEQYNSNKKPTHTSSQSNEVAKYLATLDPLICYRPGIGP